MSHYAPKFVPSSFSVLLSYGIDQCSVLTANKIWLGNHTHCVTKSWNLSHYALKGWDVPIQNESKNKKQEKNEIKRKRQRILNFPLDGRHHRSNWTKQRVIASDHSAVNGLSDTHEGRGHACKGIRMQGRVYTRVQMLELTAGYEWEFPRRAKGKRRWWWDTERCFRRTGERTQPFLVASTPSLRSLLP